MKRKIRLLFLVTVSLLVLAGFGKKSVELLSDKKLIDLNAAIAFCMPGADSAEKTEDKNQELSNDPTEPTTAPEPSSVPTVMPEDQTGAEAKERTILISVRERVISYDDGERIKLEKLKDRMKQDAGEKTTFRLVDDFAEAHVYRRIITLLEELEAEIGINYIRD